MSSLAKLSADQQTTIRSTLDRVAPNFTCTTCGSRERTILPDLIGAPLFHAENVQHPLVMVQCDSCGRVEFYSAFKVGVDPLPL